jgi:hypothetical protein
MRDYSVEIDVIEKCAIVGGYSIAKKKIQSQIARPLPI